MWQQRIRSAVSVPFPAGQHDEVSLKQDTHPRVARCEAGMWIEECKCIFLSHRIIFLMSVELISEEISNSSNSSKTMIIVIKRKP